MPVLLSDIKMPLDAPDEALCARIETEFALPGGSVRGARIVRQSLDARRKSDIHFLVSTVVMLEPSLEKRLLSRGGGRAKPYAPRRALCASRGEGDAPRANRGRRPGAGRSVRGVLSGARGLCAAGAGAWAGGGRARPGRGPLLGHRRTRSGIQRHVRRRRGGHVFGRQADHPHQGPAGPTQRLKTLARFGAPPDIVYQAKPHIGTDLLRDMVHAMRLEIERLGGEVRFGARLADIRLEEGTLRGVTVEQNGNAMREECAACVLATGQAAAGYVRNAARKGAFTRAQSVCGRGAHRTPAGNDRPRAVRRAGRAPAAGCGGIPADGQRAGSGGCIPSACVRAGRSSMPPQAPERPWSTA